MPQPDNTQTLLQWLVRNHGYIRAGKIIAFITCWITAEAELGLAVDEPQSSIAEIRDQVERAMDGDTGGYVLGIEAYAKFWKQGRSSAYKEQARFREAFAEFGYMTPRDLVNALPRWDADSAPGVALAVFPVPS